MSASNSTAVARCALTPTDAMDHGLRPTKPHCAYYEACVGQWSCPFTADVHDFAQLRAAIGFFNAFALLLIARWPAAFGRPMLATSVSMLSQELFEHTTKVSWLGVPLLWSREELALDPDGQSLVMTSTMRALPFPWFVEHAGGPGHVVDDASSATYRIAMYGGEMLQTTRRSEDEVVLEQVLPGYRAEHPLRRAT